jgi:phosphatidylinositol glycan class Z
MGQSVNMRTAKWIYLFLLGSRTLFALFGSGYIHPDEHFQNGELTAGVSSTSTLIDHL